MSIPAKALIADALVYLPVVWSAAQVRTALVLADHMFGSKREAMVSAATLARRRRVHETRVREHLAALCRRPDEAHDVRRHVFVRTYRCVPWGSGRRGGRKVSVYRLADELELAVLAARETAARAPVEAPESQGLQSVTTETPAIAALRSIETSGPLAFHSPTETPAAGDRNAGIQATETSPPGGGESGIRKPAMNPAGLRTCETPAPPAVHSPAVAEALGNPAPGAGVCSTTGTPGPALDALVRELQTAMVPHQWATYARPLTVRLAGGVMHVQAPGAEQAHYWRARVGVLTDAARRAGLRCSVVVERGPEL